MQDREDPKHSPKSALLEELTSIKALLDEQNGEPDQTQPPTEALDHQLDQELSASFDEDVLSDHEPLVDIPILEDVVAGETQPDLLNLEHIFSDKEPHSGLNIDHLEADIPFPEFKLDGAGAIAESHSDSPQEPSDDRLATIEESPDIELMIQELVDEFVPPIEAELRRRLSACSPAVLRDLAEQYLGD